VSIAKPLSYLVSIYDDNPKLNYETNTISLYFTDASGKEQNTVCVITDYKGCGEVKIDYCASVEDGKGYGNKGYSADTFGGNDYIYNQDLFQKCEERSLKIYNSRQKAILEEKDRKKMMLPNAVNAK
jgi:hypothetical protein